MYWLSNAKHNDVMFLQEKILMSYYTLIPGFFVFIHVYRNFNFKITHFVKTKNKWMMNSSANTQSGWKDSGIDKLKRSRRDRAESSTFTFYDICRVFRPYFGLSRGELGGR